MVSNMYICIINNNQKIGIMGTLDQTKKGQLVKLSTKSDVYEVLEVGFYIILKNMYTGKVSRFKPYTMRKGQMHKRKAEIVQFY